MLNEADTRQPKTARRRLQFSLRFLLLAVSFLGVVAIPLTIKLQRVFTIRTATAGIIAEIKKLGGTFDLDESGNVRSVNFHTKPPLSDEDLAAAMPYLEKLPALRTVHIYSDRLTDKGLAQLAVLTNLEKLFVYDSAITDDGVKSLSSLTRLKQVYFMKAPLTDASMESFAKLPQLGVIGVSSPAVTDRGLAHLSNLSNLYELHLAGTGTTEAGLKELADQSPKGFIVFDDNSSPTPKQYRPARVAAQISP